MSVLGEVVKNDRERIRISIEEYRGNRFCDVRVFFEDAQGEWKPTRKGITFNRVTIGEAIGLLTDAADSL